MSNAKIDQNTRASLTAVSNADDTTIVTLYADPTTHRLLVDTAGVPASPDTSVQFNDGGSFGGDAGLTYNKTTNVLTVEDISGVAGSNFTLTTPNNDTSNITIQTGNGVTANNEGGSVLLLGGSSGDSLAGGAHLVVEGGYYNLATPTGGSFTITLGAGSTNGNIQVYNAVPILSVLDFNSVASSTKTFTFPNASGTLGLVAGSNTQMIFNDGGAYAGMANTVWNKTNQSLDWDFAGAASYISIGSSNGGNSNYLNLSPSQFNFISSQTSFNFEVPGVTGVLSFASLASGSKTFTFPNLTGNVCITGVTASTGATLSNTLSGTTISNEGSGSLATYNLPTAAAGIMYTFVVQDADGIRVVANTGDTIRLAGSVSASAGRIDSTTIGSTVTLVSINATEWIATSIVGTWAVT